MIIRDNPSHHWGWGFSSSRLTFHTIFGSNLLRPANAATSMKMASTYVRIGGGS